jgi:hypothetical protein
MSENTDDYIAWAQEWCPEPVAREQGSLARARAEYDSVDDRIGDEAEEDDFLTRVLWLETAIRLARVGWTVAELEEARWPVRGASRDAALIRSGF